MWKSLLVLITLLGVTQGVKTGVILNSLSVRFSPLSGYYDMPKTVKDLEDFPDYQSVSHDEELNVDLYSYEGDPRIFVLFDNYGNIAGLRIGYIKADLFTSAVSKGLTFPYKFEKHKMYESGKYWDTDIYYTTLLFNDPAIFKQGGRKDTKGVVVENVYLKMKGVWTKISHSQCDAEKMGFTKQGCFPGMGMHYFYNMSETSVCQDLDGVFLMYEDGELVGLGIIPFGSFTYKNRIWNEAPTADIIKIIIPNRPTCLTEWVTNYGAVCLHVFFKENPKNISCNLSQEGTLIC